MLAVTIASERLVHKVPKNPQTQGRRRQSDSKLHAHTHLHLRSPKATIPCNQMPPNKRNCLQRSHKGPKTPRLPFLACQNLNKGKVHDLDNCPIIVHTILC